MAKKDDLDILEGFSFDEVLSGEIKSPEAFVPNQKKDNLNSRTSLGQGNKESISRTKLGQQKKKAKNKAGTSLEHNEDISETENRATLGHHRDISRTKRLKEFTNKDINKSETRALLGQSLGHNEDISQKITSFSLLVGLQRKLMLTCYQSAKENQSHLTKPLSTEYLQEQVQSTVMSIRKSLQRMEEKKVIAREGFKRGRGGWTIYSIPKQVFQEILQWESNNISRTSLERNENITSPKTGTETRTSGSSSIILNSLNTNNITKDELPNDWKTLQTPDALRELHWGVSQIRQVHRKGILTAEELQSSMDSFAYDKENGLLKNVHSNFLNFFCGIVIKKSIPYTSEKYLDQEKAELDRYLAKVEAKKKTQEQYFKMLKDKAFEDWKKDLSQEEINKLSPPSEFAPEGSNFQAMLLESYFNENIYKGNDEQPAEL